MSGHGARAAFGRRHPTVSRLRRAAYFGLSRRTVARGLISGRPPDLEPPAPPADHLRLQPSAHNSEQLSDLAARVNWYLPDVRVPVALERARDAVIAPEHAPWMQPDLVRDPGWLDSAPRGRSHDVVHRVGSRQALTVLRRGRASALAAPQLYTVADLGWVWLRWYFATMPSQSTPAAMERLAALGGANSSAFVLATGPSARFVDLDSVNADVRITCNSAVRDLDLLRALRPDVVCFADPVFHYGPSRYAAAFRQDLLRAVEETDCLLVTLELYAGLLIAHHPELAERLIIVRVVRGRAPWHWPTPQQMTARLTNNVLTQLMLPIAFMLSDQVDIAGCDGRQPTESYFWRHNTRTQYPDDLMATAFDAHPAFFRDRVYADYYDEHCRGLEELLLTAETAGKTAVGVTPSHIPALSRRGAPAPVA